MESSFPLNREPVATPAFVYDLGEIRKRLDILHRIRDRSNCKVLYSLKALPLRRILEEMGHLDGFSASSLFEARLARKACDGGKEIHFVSPGIGEAQWDDISGAVEYLTFNSLEQFSRFEPRLGEQSYGIRVNPRVSFVKDRRYNPCGEFSKLGVPADQVREKVSSDPGFSEKIEGIHLHTNCESKDFSQLTETVSRLKTELSGELGKFRWINLGGGYFFDESENLSLFHELVDELDDDYGFEEIMIEPGAFLVRDSGYLVSSVVDLFRRDGKSIAVLDATVNHLPEVFEYQYKPEVSGDDPSCENEYILAGSSCLAGDVFGAYRFGTELRVGSRVLFQRVGSYSLVKAHTFNGINLPDVYCVEDGDELKKVKSFTFEEYANRYGG